MLRLAHHLCSSTSRVISITVTINCDRLRENRAQRGVRNIEKRSIDFLKMYCFKPTEGNGKVYYSGNDLSYDDKTWRAQYLDADNSVSAKKFFSKGAALCLVFL